MVIGVDDGHIVLQIERTTQRLRARQRSSAPPEPSFASENGDAAQVAAIADQRHIAFDRDTVAEAKGRLRRRQLFDLWMQCLNESSFGEIRERGARDCGYRAREHDRANLRNTRTHDGTPRQITPSRSLAISARRARA
jgi:hypothetical protein